MQNSRLLSPATWESPVTGLHANANRTMAAGPSTQWLTAAEAAQYLRIRTRTLMLWARQGKVKGYVLSGTRRHVWRFHREDLDAAFFQPADLDVLHSALSSVRSAEKEAAR